MNTELTHNDIIRMAQEAGMEVHHRKGQVRIGSAVLTGCDSTDQVTRFAAVVAASARAQQDARHLEELAAYELTVSNLRAAQGVPDIHALFWQLRAKLFKLPRYSFLSPQGGGVVRVPDSSGKWIEADAAAGLCEVEEVDALIAAAPGAGCGETCKRANLCATCAGEIAAAQQPAAQPERGEIVVTKNEAGQIVAVTRQDDDGKILEVIATDIRFERESEPAPTSVSLSKRTQLEADGYVVNGVALMHPETRRRVLLDYCGFVGWWNGQVHHDQQAQQTDTVDTYATPAESASVTRQATPFESWLDAQMERIDPDRNEMGSAGHVRALTAPVRELKQAQDDDPAWHDAPACAGNWIAESASRIFRIDEFNLHAYQNTSVRWYGPIPKDEK